MLVEAISKGFYIEIKEKGDVFEVPDDFPLGSWTKKVEVASPTKKEPVISEKPVKRGRKAKVQEF
jgi:hypothetical protein